MTQLDTLLRHTISYKNEEVKRNVLKFVHYAYHDEKQQQYILEKFEKYDEMRLMEKIAIIQTILKFAARPWIER